MYELLAQPVVCLGFVILLEGTINLSWALCIAPSGGLLCLHAAAHPQLLMLKLMGFPVSFAGLLLLPPLPNACCHMQV